MDQFIAWPPPDWTEVVITWNEIFAVPDLDINEVVEWLRAYESTDRFHLYGFRITEGFAFRFENPQDAFFFKLRWS